jgi:hypothetical protein
MGRNEYNFYPVNLLNGIFEKFWGAGLTLNVDHCGDRHSPIGARVCVMEVQLSDTKIFRDDPGEAQ